jgi:hypothetical protein
VPLHQLAKGGLGLFTRKLREKLMIIQFRHSPCNVHRTLKGTGNFQEF